MSATEAQKAASKRYYWRNQKRVQQKSAVSMRTKWRTLRKHIIDHYGHRCACEGCDITQYEFLALDHVNGDGNQHRKQFSSNWGLYKWIVENNYPNTIRLLCHNCNQARGCYGFCPHEKN